MVNIKSIKHIKNLNINNTNKLSEIFKIQRKYNTLFKIQKKDIDTKEGQNQTKKFIYYIIEELMEASNCLKNRDWTNFETIVDKDHFEEELIDAFDFFIALLDYNNIDSKKLINLYKRKYHVNNFRKESKY